MMVTPRLLPTKGLPLPFISYGGTSLIMFMTMAGVLANIGLQAQAPEEEPNARIKRRAPAAA
jgi:cell division protein FtsW